MAVYKGDDGKYYETRIASQWLQENLEQSCLDALREQKMLGGY